MNVLQVNLDLITGYPKIYKNLLRNSSEVRQLEFILAGFILCMLVSAGALTYSLIRVKR